LWYVFNFSNEIGRILVIIIYCIKVDDLREIGAFINEAHYKQHTNENNLAGRVEFLPISWHQELHGETTGIDNRLKPMTLPSIPKVFKFSNRLILL
jgi:hypothetical protein